LLVRLGLSPLQGLPPHINTCLSSAFFPIVNPPAFCPSFLFWVPLLHCRTTQLNLAFTQPFFVELGLFQRLRSPLQNFFLAPGSKTLGAQDLFPCFFLCTGSIPTDPQTPLAFRSLQSTPNRPAPTGFICPPILFFFIPFSPRPTAAVGIPPPSSSISCRRPFSLFLHHSAVMVAMGAGLAMEIRAPIFRNPLLFSPVGMVSQAARDWQYPAPHLWVEPNGRSNLLPHSCLNGWFSRGTFFWGKKRIRPGQFLIPGCEGSASLGSRPFPSPAVKQGDCLRVRFSGWSGAISVFGRPPLPFSDLFREAPFCRLELIIHFRLAGLPPLHPRGGYYHFPPSSPTPPFFRDASGFF